MKKQQKVGLAVVGVIVLIIIGIVNGGGKSTPTSSTSPIASTSALGSAAATPTFTATSTPTPSVVATKSTPSGRYPLTNGGNCYEPGEYCRNSDHGASGVAGDGERITCEDNDGWRWEPA